MKKTVISSIVDYAQSVLESSGGGGLAIGIVRDNNLICAHGVGYRDVERKLPVTPQTVFSIASVTKPFTTTLAGILVDRGLLSWDEPIKEFLSDFKMVHSNSTEKISLIHLLSHRTGLPRHDYVWLAENKLNRSDILNQVAYLEAFPDIGERFQYNNLMYAVAGLSQERVGQKCWEQLIYDEIFRPLGMKSSFTYYTDLLNQLDHALPYSVDSRGHLVQVQPWHLKLVPAAGAIQSSLEDLSRFAILHLNRGSPLLSINTFNRIHERNATISTDELAHKFLYSKMYPNENVYYQLGWRESNRNSVKIVHHDGCGPGYVAELMLVPEQRLAIILLSNNDHLPISLLAIDMVDELLEKGNLGLAQKQIVEAKNQSFNARPSKELLLDKMPPSWKELIGTYLHAGKKIDFEIKSVDNYFKNLKNHSPLEIKFLGKTFEFVPFDNSQWILWTEDLMCQYFLFVWDPSQQGFYIRETFERTDVPKAFFRKQKN